MSDSTWKITAENISTDGYHGVTVANGMIGLVSDARPFQVKDVILNGVYDQYGRGRVSNILKGFNHLDFELFVDHELIQEDHYHDFDQTLDMQQAKLITSVEIDDRLSIKQEMMSLRQLPYCSLVNFEIKANKATRFAFGNRIETPHHLRENRQYFSQIDRPHVMIPLLTSEADSPSGNLSLAACNTFLFDAPHGSEPELIHEEWDHNAHLLKFYVDLKPGEVFRFSVAGSVCSSAHFSEPRNEAERLSLFCKLEGRERLESRHISEWLKIWEKDILIEGDDTSQRDVRFLLYHLYSFCREGNDLSLSPMGLSGLGYNGHVFWDAELWMYPPLLVMNPGMAKSILEYRFKRLEAAKQNAFAHGYKGAMFPWESAEDGYEQAPVWALTGPFQQHITACVGWAFWKYFEVTQDTQWLRERGWPVLKEVATFWVDRVERNGPGQYDIRNVIGANEFEENIDNNAFTNGIVKVVLKYATQAADILGLEADMDWQHVAENIPILEFEDGTTKENETYDGTIIKQSDANLLSHPIRLFTDAAKMKKDLEYYEPRMSPDGPAMGVSTLATLHAILDNPDRAFELFQKSYVPNGVGPFNVLSECAGGKGVAPFFATGAGGTLQTVLFGFGGITINEDGLKRGKQKLPSHWRKLEIRIG